MDSTITFIGLAVGCCLAIPTALILYVLMGKIHDWWAEKLGLDWLL